MDFGLVASGTPFGIYDVDISIGAGGSEVAVVPDYEFGNAGNTMPQGFVIPFTPLPVPAGTRIAARASSNNGGAISPLYITFYGIYQ